MKRLLVPLLLLAAACDPPAPAPAPAPAPDTRPTAEIVEQLRHADDAAARAAAAGALGGRAGDPAAREALLAAIDADAASRVRAAALHALVGVSPDDALKQAGDMLSRNSEGDVERIAALEVLGAIDASETWVMLMSFVGPRASRPARLTALRGLVAKAATGRQAELALIVAPMLADPDVEIRLAVAEALTTLRVPETVPILEERRGLETDPRVRSAIDAALASIRGGGS